MPVTDVTPDIENRTLTVTAEFAAPVERVWQVYADKSQLQQVFGPPGYPATFDEHDLSPGGRSHYYMTSPEGEKYDGIWRIGQVEQPRSFTFEDAFADENYQANADLPVSENSYTFTESAVGTRAVYVSTYSSAEALQQVLDMGVVEGGTAAINQIDELLAS